MQIRQLQIAHDTLQDRLVLRVATQADEEYRLWLTRRFLGELWPHLARLMVEPPLHASPPATEGNTAEPNYAQPFRDDNASYPLGATPLLVSEVKVDALADGGCHLTFREGRERSFQLGLPPELLQALCAMLRAGAGQARWNLALDYRPLATPASGVTPSSRFH